MPQNKGSPKNNNKKKTQANRQGDWICQLCNNYNYSFRMKCNRCQVQSKEYNNTLTIFYEEDSYYISELPPTISQQTNEYNYWEEQEQKYFPNVVFISLDDKPWDISRQDVQQRRDSYQNQNWGWINQLIQD